MGVSWCSICHKRSGSFVSVVEKRGSGSKIMSSLSFTPLSNPGRLDRISALELAFPGI